MIEHVCTVGLVVERRRSGGAWGGVIWRPHTVFPAAPEVAPWTPLGGSVEAMRFYAGALPLHLYSTDTANYRDNLMSGEPKLWVVLRPDGDEPPVEVMLVTADPAEGEGSTESGAYVVEALPMPAEVAGVVAEFVAAHHIDRPRIKRKRDRGRPDGRRAAPGRDAGEGEPS